MTSALRFFRGDGVDPFGDLPGLFHQPFHLIPILRV
jgi:hypothetical protein